jgi:hypothetical protein
MTAFEKMWKCAGYWLIDFIVPKLQVYRDMDVPEERRANAHEATQQPHTKADQV